MTGNEIKGEKLENNNESYINELLEGSEDHINGKKDLKDKIEKSKQGLSFIIYNEKNNALYKIENGEIKKEIINSEEKKEEGIKKIEKSTKDSLYALLDEYKNNSLS